MQPILTGQAGCLTVILFDEKLELKKHRSDIQSERLSHCTGKALKNILIQLYLIDSIGLFFNLEFC